MSTVLEIVGGVISAGVGTGLVVLVARSKREDTRLELLDQALRIALPLALPVALALALAGWLLNDFLSGGKVPPWVFSAAAAAGWIGVIPMLVSNYWLGQRRYGAMLAMLTGQSIATLLVGMLLFAPYGFPAESVLGWIVIVQALPAGVLLFIPRASGKRPTRRPHPLRRYILPGLSVGILGPLSILLARGTIADALSWHDAGVLQALFRLADWVCVIAAGFLSLRYLPRFAAARGAEALASEMRSAAKIVLLPSAAALCVLLALHRPLLEALYDRETQASTMTVALLFAGSLVRIAAWIPLFALYARRRTREIAIGELLSLPLFAALAYAARSVLTLELAGALWLVAYCAYCAYNMLALRKHQDSKTVGSRT